MIQLQPSIPIITPKGKALAFLVNDCGDERDLEWTCWLDSNGECWTFRNRDIRAQKNVTQGREYISPFYDPDDVKLPCKHQLDMNYDGNWFCKKCNYVDVQKKNKN